ncbi:hypothetical protein [Streptosporangium sp. NPDC002607]
MFDRRVQVRGLVDLLDEQPGRGLGGPDRGAVKDDLPGQARADVLVSRRSATPGMIPFWAAGRLRYASAAATTWSNTSRNWAPPSA